MNSRDWKDIIAGALFVGLGLSVSSYAATHYPLGTLQLMGSGMFPAAIGVAMALLGLLILAPALARSGEFPLPQTKSVLAVCGSISAFASILPLIGLLPAIFALVAISSIAAPKFDIRAVLIVSVILCLVSYIVFNVLLGSGIPMIRGKI